MSQKDTVREKQRTADLISVLKDLLVHSKAGTQEEIKQLLQQQGFDVNQSKISRLLRQIGAVKTTNEHKQIVYSLPREPAPPSTQSQLIQLIIDVVANETLIIIHTNPGSAGLIGRLLDHNQKELGILGTVAGDDTIFVVPKSTRQIQQTLRAIKKHLSNIS